jgi:ribulose-5-phosphate 4-epimerase/fuculose-1-phosphate aldolase
MSQSSDCRLAFVCDGEEPMGNMPRPHRPGDERQELTAIIQELYARNLITASGGNVSLRASGREGKIWITPSGLFKGALRPDMMVPLDLEGRVLARNTAVPSIEKWMHIAILKRRPDINGVIHTHAPWATLLALSETPFLPISVEAALIGEIPRLPFILPGTRALAEAVAAAMGEHGSAVLMQNHGLVVAAADLRQAATLTEIIERCCELILRCLMLGKQPPTLPEDAVRQLREQPHLKG